jgi:hypothetical protein
MAQFVPSAGRADGELTAQGYARRGSDRPCEEGDKRTDGAAGVALGGTAA